MTEDPSELEIVQELMKENIIFIIHDEGVTILMDDEKTDRTTYQLKTFSRLYVASSPSLPLRFFLFLEMLLVMLGDTLERLFSRE